MKHFLIALSFSLLPLIAHAEPEAPIQCKAGYSAAVGAVIYTNQDLNHRGSMNYESDCLPLFEEMLKTKKLPEVDGRRVPAHLVYEVRDDEQFILIRRILAATRDGVLRIAIRFSVDETGQGDPGEMTTVTVEASDRPAAPPAPIAANE